LILFAKVGIKHQSINQQIFEFTSARWEIDKRPKNIPVHIIMFPLTLSTLNCIAYPTVVVAIFGLALIPTLYMYHILRHQIEKCPKIVITHNASEPLGCLKSEYRVTGHFLYTGKGIYRCATGIGRLLQLSSTCI
jgi:hypothetical protein